MHINTTHTYTYTYLVNQRMVFLFPIEMSEHRRTMVSFLTWELPDPTNHHEPTRWVKLYIVCILYVCIDEQTHSYRQRKALAITTQTTYHEIYVHTLEHSGPNINQICSQVVSKKFCRYTYECVKLYVYMLIHTLMNTTYNIYIHTHEHTYLKTCIGL